jgi:hypothetical protein
MGFNWKSKSHAQISTSRRKALPAAPSLNIYRALATIQGGEVVDASQFD